MMPRRIRLFWTVGAVLAVLMVAGVAAAVLVPRLLPLGDEGSLYRRYRNMPGIEATYLKDFPIDDSVTIDVTMLHAQDTNVWNNTVMKLFHVENPDEYIPREITFLLIPKNADGDPENKTLLDHDLIAGDKKELTIGLFHLENEKQYDAIFETYFNNLIK